MSVISQERQIETMALVLTPKVVTKFGRNFFRGPSLDNLAARAEDAYSLAVQKDFGATARSKSVAAFNEKWNTAVNRYSHNYEQIMHLYLHGLGSSFPLAYVKALSDTLHEIQRLSFAVGDLIDLYQKHISKSLRIAAVYDVLEEQYGPPKMEEVKAALRNSNFGISLIFLCCRVSSSDRYGY